AEPALEDLRGRVVERPGPAVDLDLGGGQGGEPEVAQLDRLAEQQQVGGLDVAVLDADALPVDDVLPAVQEVEGPGRLRQVVADVVEDQPGAELHLVGLEQVQQAAVGQGHGDDDVTPAAPDLVDVNQVGVAQPADDLDGAHLL